MNLFKKRKERGFSPYSLGKLLAYKQRLRPRFPRRKKGKMRSEGKKKTPNRKWVKIFKKNLLTQSATSIVMCTDTLTSCQLEDLSAQKGRKEKKMFLKVHAGGGFHVGGSVLGSFVLFDYTNSGAIVQDGGREKRGGGERGGGSWG